MSLLPAHLKDRWKECVAQSPNQTLKLSVLRDLARYLHSERSRITFTQAHDAARFHEIEARVFSCFTDGSGVGADELEEFLRQAPSTQKPPEPKTSATLAAIIPKQKLERYDRQWEWLLAETGLKEGFVFWRAAACVRIHEIEKFEDDWSRKLWPRGLILFAESDPNYVDKTSPGMWTGVWTLICRGEQAPEDSLPIGSIGRTVWTRLFPPATS